MENSILVPDAAQNVVRGASCDSNDQEDTDAPSRSRNSTPPISEATTSWVSCIRSKLQDQGIGPEATSIILDSWRKGTKNQYSSSLKHWLDYCKQHTYSITTPSLPQVLEFLTQKSTALGYSAMGTLRSALSSFITVEGFSLGDHPLIKRFMTGIFNRKPSLPRYTETWDPHVVLDYFKTLPENDQLHIKPLTMKLTVLIALISAQRLQTLQSLSLDGMSSTNDSFCFNLLVLLKQTSRNGGKNRHLQ